MSGFRSFVLGGLLAAGLAGGAQASVVTYSGSDNGVAPNSLIPGSLAAAGNFLANAGPVALITFEGLTPGAPTSFSPATGVTLSRTGGDYGVPITGINNTQQGSAIFGFNTTAGGNTWFGTPEGSMTFAFDVPILSFGTFMTGMEDPLGGDILVSFDNGIPLVYNVLANNDGGVQFFGVVSTTPFASITLSKTSGGDAWGVDDVYYTQYIDTPEPASAALLVAGLLGLAARRRRG